MSDVCVVIPQAKGCCRMGPLVADARQAVQRGGKVAGRCSCRVLEAPDYISRRTSHRHSANQYTQNQAPLQGESSRLGLGLPQHGPLAITLPTRLAHSAHCQLPRAASPRPRLPHQRGAGARSRTPPPPEHPPIAASQASKHAACRPTVPQFPSLPAATMADRRRRSPGGSHLAAFCCALLLAATGAAAAPGAGELCRPESQLAWPVMWRGAAKAPSVPTGALSAQSVQERRHATVTPSL